MCAARDPARQIATQPHHPPTRAVRRASISIAPGQQIAEQVRRSRATAREPVEANQDQRFKRDQDEDRVDDKAAGKEISHAKPAPDSMDEAMKAWRAEHPDHGETTRNRWARSLKKIRACASGSGRTSSLFM